MYLYYKILKYVHYYSNTSFSQKSKKKLNNDDKYSFNACTCCSASLTRHYNISYGVERKFNKKAGGNVKFEILRARFHKLKA